MENTNKSRALLISCFDWYEKRLKYIGEVFENKGYRVDYISSNFDHIKKCHTEEYKNIKHFYYVDVPKYSRNISLKRIYSHKIFTKRIVKIIKKTKPDLVYCLIPPNSLTKDIAKLKKKYKFKLIYDVIDLWPESFPKGRSENWVFRSWKNYRDCYINLADKIVLECNFYKNALGDIASKSKLEVIPIVKPNIGNVKMKGFTQDIALAYIGSINSLIDIEKILDIVSSLIKEKTVLIRIIGEGENREYFLNRLKNIGAEVEFYGKIFDDLEKKKILGLCDFGINIYRPNISVGLTLKSVDYFQLGLPILNSIEGDTEELVRNYHIGINGPELNKENIIAACDNILELKKNVSEMFINRFVPEVLMSKIEKIIFQIEK